ncbi:hypothetical protein GOP47_0015794 [Adiantum capillus-veneris]|uniref:Uncharacterized protein n=1 Tax=Adiantum capillus-veneris TaxID=13818 RepID=A0A9D4UKB4_ADICA|nr:hypothetical protein GOP47_0015794 [Adiantum capillus-veneris]
MKIANDQVTIYRTKKDILKDSQYLYNQLKAGYSSEILFEDKELTMGKWEKKLDIEIVHLESRIRNGNFYLERLPAEIDEVDG